MRRTGSTSASVYLKLSDAEHAIGALEESRALDPSQGRAVSYLGLAYARAGRYGEAYRAFLIAGQNDLAIEIESNLPAGERERIHAQLGRSPQGLSPPEAAVPRAAASAPRATAPAGIPTPAPAGLPAPIPTGAMPRTAPPSAPPPPRSRTPSQEIAVIRDREPSREIAIRHELDDAVALDHAAETSGAPAAPGAAEPARITDSMQFVLPRAASAAIDRPPEHAPDGPSMISRAVAIATPSTTTGMRTKAGGFAPRPLSELATDDLVRPDDGEDIFEVAANGTLIIRVTSRVMSRLDGVHITGGDLGYELAMRRSRGHNTDEPFDHGGSQVHAVTGNGYLIAVPGKHSFSAVVLDDDILYLREDLVFAFEASLRWENGNVPGLRGKLPIVQFRGDGSLALRTGRPLVRIKLPAQGVVYVDAERLAGWVGRVIPRTVVPPAGGPLGAMCVECTGEGIVLVEPAPDDQLAAPRAVPKRSRITAELEAAQVAPLKQPDDGGDDNDGNGRAGSTGAGPPTADLDLDRLDEL